VDGHFDAGMWGWFNVTSVPSAFSGRHFILIAGEAGALRFNGTSPGPALAVSLGTFVWLTFEVSAAAGITHSWVLIRATGNATSPPVFPGAATPNPALGDGLGSVVNVTFLASAVGQYKYICEVDGHFDAGMWGNFTVSVPPTSPPPYLPPRSSMGSDEFAAGVSRRGMGTFW
jgi:plastocyanin